MSTKDIVYIALFAALTAALGLFPPITLPIAGGVPITAQSMGPMLAGALAGAKRGGLALALFALLVAIGLPLMAGGRGGFGLFLTPSGGFTIWRHTDKDVEIRHWQLRVPCSHTDNYLAITHSYM